MPAASLYSAPEECYLDHISRCEEKFEILLPLFYSTIVRTFDAPTKEEILKEYFLKMIRFHDLGKLTKKWQQNLGKKLPSHAPIGAAYLYKKFLEESTYNDLKGAIVFAIAIHHTDSGLLGDNIEKPDVQAIVEGIVDSSGKIIWAPETKALPEEFFPKELNDASVENLKNMARGLRKWAKGCSLLEQHQRRLQASLAHHILKLCDISAATERKEYQKKEDQDYYGGWLMVENIKNYVDAIGERTKP